LIKGIIPYLIKGTNKFNNKVVLENVDGLRCLSDLVAAQCQYHKAAFEALQELSPELDELVITNEVGVN
jgi:hypothetical protein